MTRWLYLDEQAGELERTGNCDYFRRQKDLIGRLCGLNFDAGWYGDLTLQGGRLTREMVFLEQWVRFMENRLLKDFGVDIGEVILSPEEEPVGLLIPQQTDNSEHGGSTAAVTTTTSVPSDESTQSQ